MTQKRFTMKGSTILENNEEITAWDCCDLLNELHEENVILKKIIDEDDVLVKSLLSAYYNEKWEDFCKNYGVDFDE